MSLPRRFDSKSKIDGLEGTPGIYRKLTEAEVIADYIESKKGDLLFNDYGPSKIVSKDESTENKSAVQTTVVKSGSSINSIEREQKTFLQTSSPKATSTSISKTTKHTTTSTHRTGNTTAALQFFKDRYRTKDEDNPPEIHRNDGNKSSSSSSSSNSPTECKSKRNKSLNVDKSFVPVNDYYNFYQVNNQQPEFLTEEKIQILRKDNDMMIKQHELKMLAKKYHKRSEYNPYDQIAYFGPVVLNASGEPQFLENPQFISGLPLEEEVRTESTNLSTFKPHVHIENVEKQELDTKPVKQHSLKSSFSSESENENHLKNQKKPMENVQKKDEKDDFSLGNKDRKMSSGSSSSSENSKEKAKNIDNYQTKQSSVMYGNSKKASMSFEHSLFKDDNSSSSSSTNTDEKDKTPKKPKYSGKISKDTEVPIQDVVTKDSNDTSSDNCSEEDSSYIQNKNMREQSPKWDIIKGDKEDQCQNKSPEEFQVEELQNRKHFSSSTSSNGDNYIEIPSLPADHEERSNQTQLPLPLPIPSPRPKNSSNSSSSNDNGGDNYIEIPPLPPSHGHKKENIPADPIDTSITSSDSSFLQHIPADNTYSEPYEMEPAVPKQLRPNGIDMEKLEAQIITDVSRTPSPPPLPSSNPPPLRKDIPSDFNIEHTIKKIKGSDDTPLPEYEDDVFEAKMIPNYHDIVNQYLENGSVEIRTNKETQLTNDLKQPSVNMDIKQQPDKAKRRHSSHSCSSSDSTSDDGKKKQKKHSENVSPSKDCHTKAHGMNEDKRRSSSSNSSSDTEKKEDKPSPPPRKTKKTPDEQHRDVVDTPTQTNDDVDTTDKEVQVCEDSLEGKDLKAGDFLDFSISTSESPSAFSTPRGPCNKIRSVSSYSSSSEDENKKPYKIKGTTKKDLKQDSNRVLFPEKPKEDPSTVETVLKNTPALPLKLTDKSISSSDSISSENITSYNVNLENESDKDKKLEEKAPEYEVEIKVPKIPKRKDKSQPPEIPKRKTKQSIEEKESKGKNNVGSHSSSSSSSSDSNSDDNKNSKKKRSSKQKPKRSDSGGIRAKIGEFFKRKDKKSKSDKKDREKKKSITDEECQKEVAKVIETQPRSPENIYDELIVQKGKNGNLSPSKTSTNNSAKTIKPTIDLSSIKGEADIEKPSIPNVGLPNIDLPSCNVDIGKPSLPSVISPSVKGDIDIGKPSLPCVNSPSVKGDIDIGKPSLPSVKGDVDIGKPALPSVNSPSVRGDFDIGKPSLPSANLPSVKGDIDIGKPSLPCMNLPSVEGDIDIGKPSLPCVNLPSVKGDIDIGKPSLPSMNLPSVKGDIDIGKPSLPSMNLPNVEVDIDIEKPLLDVNLPNSSGDKPYIPNMELPKLKGDIDNSKIDSPIVDCDVKLSKPTSPTLPEPKIAVTREQEISSDTKYSIPPIDLSGITNDNNSPIHKTIVSVPGDTIHMTSGEPQKPSRKPRNHKNKKDGDGTKREKGKRKRDKFKRKRSSSSSSSSSSTSSSPSSHTNDTSHDNSIIIEQSQNHTPEKQRVPDKMQTAVSSPLAITPSVTIKSPTKDIYATPNKIKSDLLNVDMPESPTVSEGNHFVVVAIDFGTTFSGYAFSFVRDPENILMMRKWEGGDPGVINQKTPTIILLEPHGKFHSFGFTARDAYNDLDPKEAASWLYFDKFKMVLHHQSELTKDTTISASNGMLFPALNIFAYALRFLKDHALQELSDQSGFEIVNEDIRWVITVPAIWKAPAKQFMRQAAYSANLVSSDSPDKLLIALEPEAASIYCRKLKMHQLIPEYPIQRPLQSPKHARPEQIDTSDACDIGAGTRYMVVDCGGGTVDITVHELNLNGKLVELHKATGGPYGAIGVDIEFEKLLCCIFGKEFIINYKQRYPVGWVNLMANFESRKRSANPIKPSSSNISLPFSFIDYHKKHRGRQVESMVKKHGDKDVRWSAQGMLRLSPEAMKLLFIPTIDKIKQAIGDVINHPNARRLKYLFLVGGFAESPIVQHEIRKEFDSNKKHIVKVLIPQAVSLAILKGAVMYGLDPTVVNVRRSRLTYGIGVLNRFDSEKHPQSKLVTRDDKEWCTDVFEKFVVTDEPVALGDVVIKSYTPAVSGQNKSIINIYCSEDENVQFITDIGVMKCGTLTLDLSENDIDVLPYRREIQIRMCFGDTEIKVSVHDISTNQIVRSTIDFLNK